MDCNTCMHYLVCKHTTNADYVKKVAAKAQNEVVEHPDLDDFDIIVTCKHEKHSNDVMAAR